MSRKPCRFHNTPKGCRLGSSCSFLHSNKPSTNSPTELSDSDRRSNSPQHVHSSSNSQAKPPYGVCNFYWTTGRCNREFSCRFEHTMSSNTHPLNPRASQRDAASSTIDDIAPYLTEAGLAKVTGSGTDILFSTSTLQLSPNEAHNYLKKFLLDHFRFRTTLEIYAFLKVLTSASTTNSSWTQEDGQLFLSVIASDNAILRIGDILQWSPVSIRAGSNRTILSFQRGFLPLLRYFSSEFVVKSTLTHLVNALYLQIKINFEKFANVVEECINQAITAKTFKDHQYTVTQEPIGGEVFASLADVIFECLTRFKNMIATETRIAPLVRNLQEWVNAWIQGISSLSPTFDDRFKGAPAARDHFVNHLKSKVSRLIAIVEREEGKVNRSQREEGPAFTKQRNGANEAVVSALWNCYEGPGDLRPKGPRHDNDFVDIQQIRTAPTQSELTSRHPPFLPTMFHDAPHPLPVQSMERLLDIQFRLLREELTASLRNSVQRILDDLKAPSRSKTRLSDLLQKRGGKYRGYTDGQESLMFNVYTNVEFSSLIPDRRGISVSLSMDTPPGRARSSQSRARAFFWESVGGKRLMQGGLVALIWKSGNDIDVNLGIIASSLRDLTDSAKRSVDRLGIRVVFFDSSVELRMLDALKHSRRQSNRTTLILEAPVMFEAIRPFLEALRVEPESVPFAKYLVHRPRGFFDNFKIDPPRYALAPGFSYELSSLFPEDAGVLQLKMTVTDPNSVDAARQELRRSRLDPSQADAVIDTLTRELSLIQGPPGTGKSFTGIELIRLLLENKIRPILLIAFTNHALDHMLCSVLDAGITKSIVRLGSRSADERISKFSIETLEMVSGQSRLNRTFGRHHRNLKEVQKEIEDLMQQYSKTFVDSQEIMEYIEIQYPEHSEHISFPPLWISRLKSLSSFNDGDDKSWRRVGKNGRKSDLEDDSIYAYWKSGQDLDFIRQQPAMTSSSSASPPQEPIIGQNKFGILSNDDMASAHSDSISEQEDESDTDDLPPEERWKRAWVHSPSPVEVPLVESMSISPSSEEQPAIPEVDNIQLSDMLNPLDFFLAHGIGEIPAIPLSDRSLEELLSIGEMWSLALPERQRLHDYWVETVRLGSQQNRLEEFERLRERHTQALNVCNEAKDEDRRQLLKNVNIVGCTTTGAAKLTSLLKGLDPRIMLVEEAGQVLEAHVLGSLVPSVEHLILIGDPLQLRPSINNYTLSMDNRRGRELYKFDMSLMERLSTSGLPMSQINVQRRMRPTISDLIRHTLYPNLQDHDLVKKYPPVRGFAKNVFFLSHNYRESGGEDNSESRYNTYEVDMIKDLVLYLLRQGCYSQEGDIVVLCAYLGQLAKVRDALSKEVAVIIDERDQAELVDNARDDEVSEEQDGSISVEHIKVSKQVRIRTVDNYQGEEAKIIILSLVRNSGVSDDEGELLGHSSAVRHNIGFLKSENRTNVALSRAREGLFILGNSLNLASRSRMWNSVIDELEKQEAVGAAFPVACHRHPDTTEYVSRPGKLPKIAPDGGCLRLCDTRLKCGHLCTYKCHPDDPNHLSVSCSRPCARLCPRGHPCQKECADQCGNCQFPEPDIRLPCGHTKQSVPCHLLDNLSEVHCDVVVTKQLLNCEHTADLDCAADPSQHRCNSRCGGIMLCCGRDCRSRCHDCQGENVINTNPGEHTRKAHCPHRCQKTLFCEHQCQSSCSQEHQCTRQCKEPCRQQCRHARCKDYCSDPCAPCKEPCTWICPHYKCPVPCGSVCARLPCDKRCNEVLNCGHRCPSVCGEDCSIQTCPICASGDAKSQIVDLIMQRTLKEINTNGDTLDELLIRIPNCKHVFTAETLDGVCHMNEYYRRDEASGKWLGLIAPPHGFQKPPVCPTCRAAVTSPRYGRVFKRADLDILEFHTIGRMSRALHDVWTSIQSFSKEDAAKRLTNMVAGVNTSQLPSSTNSPKLQGKERAAALKKRCSTASPVQLLNPGDRKFHDIAPAVAKIWGTVTKPLNDSYRKTYEITASRSAHVTAWEAAFSHLYHQEMERSSSNQSYAPRRPTENAMRIAKMTVGQPQPRADKRYSVEAIWTTLDIRFTLVDLAQTLLKAICKTSYSTEQRQSWGLYVAFLLETCAKDAQLAFEVAEGSESRRQMTTCCVFKMRIDLERFRFNVEMIRQSGMTAEDRKRMRDRASQKISDTEKEVQGILDGHMAIDRPEQTEEVRWLADNFTSKAGLILTEWRKIEDSLRSDTFYQPISLEERIAIVKSFDFSHTGHFYNCPNGHTYVIADCGGAMQHSFCQECGARIGGSNHTLEANNTQAPDLENLARQHGAQQNPWPWAV